jgi:hypothetical protein
MTGQWLPLHENHAINVMALAITFAEPIPAPMFRKAFAAAEGAATAAGLLHRQPLMNGIQFSVVNGVMQPAQQAPSGGGIFSSYYENDLALSAISSQPLEQVQIESSNIVYRTWNYVSWSWQRDRYFELLSKAFETIDGMVAPAAIRLEYQDRFFFDGNPHDADPATLLKAGSRYVAPHVFDERGVWHSHTGSFLDGADVSRKLLQINIDANTEGEREGSRRWVTITTSRENRFSTNFDESVPFSAELIGNVIDLQHAELIDALAATISGKTASQIYLEE